MNEGGDGFLFEKFGKFGYGGNEIFTRFRRLIQNFSGMSILTSIIIIISLYFKGNLINMYVFNNIIISFSR